VIILPVLFDGRAPRDPVLRKGWAVGICWGKTSIPPGPGKRGKSIPQSRLFFSPYGAFNRRSNTNSIRTPTLCRSVCTKNESRHNGTIPARFPQVHSESRHSRLSPKPLPNIAPDIRNSREIFDCRRQLSKTFENRTRFSNVRSDLRKSLLTFESPESLPKSWS